MSDCKIDAISSTPVFQAKLFEVDEYHIKLKSGKEVVHHVAKRHPTVTIFALTNTHEIYLLKQYRYMLKTTLLEAVAGFIDEGETPFQAAKRELKEETGIIASSWEEIGKLEMAGSVFQAQSHLFLARDLELGKAEPEEDEEITLVKMPFTDAVAKVYSGEITTSASVAGILMLERLLKK